MCQTSVIFGVKKDGRLIINTLTIILFHMQNLFQNGPNGISEMVNIIIMQVFGTKRILYSSDFLQILPVCDKN